MSRSPLRSGFHGDVRRPIDTMTEANAQTSPDVLASVLEESLKKDKARIADMIRQKPADLVRACNERVAEERVTLTWASLGHSVGRSANEPSLVTRTAPADSPCDAWLLPGLWVRSPDEMPATYARQAPLIAGLRALPRNALLWTYCAGVGLAAAAGRRA